MLYRPGFSRGSIDRPHIRNFPARAHFHLEPEDPHGIGNLTALLEHCADIDFGPAGIAKDTACLPAD